MFIDYIFESCHWKHFRVCLYLYWSCSFARRAPNGRDSSSSAPGLVVVVGRLKGRQWKGKLFEILPISFLHMGLQRGNYLPSLTAASAVLLRCLNCFDLGLDWQRIGFHFKGKLQVAAFPKDWKRKKSQKWRPHWQEKKELFRKRSRNIFSNMIYDMPEEKE